MLSFIYGLCFCSPSVGLYLAFTSWIDNSGVLKWMTWGWLTTYVLFQEDSSCYSCHIELIIIISVHAHTLSRKKNEIFMVNKNVVSGLVLKFCSLLTHNLCLILQTDIQSESWRKKVIKVGVFVKFLFCHLIIAFWKYWIQYILMDLY